MEERIIANQMTWVVGNTSREKKEDLSRNSQDRCKRESKECRIITKLVEINQVLEGDWGKKAYAV